MMSGKASKRARLQRLKRHRDRESDEEKSEIEAKVVKTDITDLVYRGVPPLPEVTDADLKARAEELEQKEEDAATVARFMQQHFEANGRLNRAAAEAKLAEWQQTLNNNAIPAAIREGSGIGSDVVTHGIIANLHERIAELDAEDIVKQDEEDGDEGGDEDDESEDEGGDEDDKSAGNKKRRSRARAMVVGGDSDVSSDDGEEDSMVVGDDEVEYMTSDSDDSDDSDRAEDSDDSDYFDMMGHLLRDDNPPPPPAVIVLDDDSSSSDDEIEIVSSRKANSSPK